MTRSLPTWTLRLGALAMLAPILSGCSATPPEPPASTAVAPPPPYVYITGDWVCTTDDPDSPEAKPDMILYQFRIGASTIDVSSERPGMNDRYWSHLTYTIVDSKITTTPEEGIGWAIIMPEALDYAAPNYFRLEKLDGAGGTNVQVALAENSATWTDDDGIVYSCERTPIDPR